MGKVFIYSLLFTTLLAKGTVQVPDRLIVVKDTFAIKNYPLYEYLQSDEGQSLIAPNPCFSSSCWRGYQALWEIKNDSLFLVKIENCFHYDDCKPFGVNLKNHFGSEKVFFKWFSGKIAIPYQKAKRMNSLQISFEKELHISFMEGKKRSEVLISNLDLVKYLNKREKVDIACQAAIDTIFFYLQAELANKTDKTTIDCRDDFILRFSKNGKIKSCKYFDEQSNDFESLIANLATYPCRRKIKMALKDLDLSYLEYPEMELELILDLSFYKNSRASYFQKY